jgi:hypothetical protein
MPPSVVEESSSPPRRRRSERKRVEGEMGRDGSEEERSSRRRTAEWGKRWVMEKCRERGKCRVIVREEKRMVEEDVGMWFWWGDGVEKMMMLTMWMTVLWASKKSEEMRSEETRMAKRMANRMAKRKAKAKATRMRKERTQKTRGCG